MIFITWLSSLLNMYSPHSRHLQSHGVPAHSYCPNEKTHSMKNKVSFGWVGGYYLTPIRWKTFLLPLAAKFPHASKMKKSHLHDRLDLTDNENPAWNMLLRWVSTPYTYVASLLLLQWPSLWWELECIRVNVHGSLWGISLPHTPYLYVTRFLPFTFPSVSGSASQATVTAVGLPLTGQTFKFSGAVVGATKDKDPRFKNALMDILKANNIWSPMHIFHGRATVFLFITHERIFPTCSLGIEWFLSVLPTHRVRLDISRHRLLGIQTLASCWIVKCTKEVRIQLQLLWNKVLKDTV